jgi:seryl-tRNA synthetase
MLDLKFIRKQGDAVRNGIAKKKFNCDCDTFIAIDGVIPKISDRGGLLTQRNNLQKLGAKNKKSIRKENLIES